MPPGHNNDRPRQRGRAAPSPRGKGRTRGRRGRCRTDAAGPGAGGAAGPGPAGVAGPDRPRAHPAGSGPPPRPERGAPSPQRGGRGEAGRAGRPRPAPTAGAATAGPGRGPRPRSELRPSRCRLALRAAAAAPDCARRALPAGCGTGWGQRVPEFRHLPNPAPPAGQRGLVRPALYGERGRPHFPAAGWFRRTRRSFSTGGNRSRHGVQEGGRDPAGRRMGGALTRARGSRGLREAVSPEGGGVPVPPPAPSGEFPPLPPRAGGARDSLRRPAWPA
ncbi:collagen alpha-1(I) chain-like [Manacus candei]|uniref:collagen alpha-1(I) chain-like n=1 Tax=Manacus candei TaxID=415023 RepID=UPI002227F2B0|nr:collagen alpha-1(I) chain-like [Manacus candei]